MWLVYSLITVVLWSLSEIFYKRGNKELEKYSHLKTSIFVGIIMGIHAIITLIVYKQTFNPINIIYYLPVSLSYILSMTLSYFGVRFIEESIADPIENTSGAIVPVLCALILHQEISIYSFIAIAVIVVGVLGVGFVEYKGENRKINLFKKVCIWAITFPILYAVFDAVGTFLDIYYLDLETTLLTGVTEDNIEIIANSSYEFTFLIVAIVLYIFIRIKGTKLFTKEFTQKDKIIAASFETGGQLAYVFALSDNGAISSPLIASGTVIFSLLLSRLVLKEKISKWQYIFIIIIIAGIVALSILEN